MDCFVAALLAMTEPGLQIESLRKAKQEKMSNSPLREYRIPVIVGVGEIVDRPKNIAAGREPLALLEHAMRRAEADSGAKLLGDLGSLDVVNFLNWRYRDPEKQLAARRGADGLGRGEDG